MNKGFLTKTHTDSSVNNVIVYGINKVFCNGCTKQLQHQQTVYACEHATVFTDKLDEEYRDIHCYDCMHKRNFYCDKVSVNHNGGKHIDMKAKLWICPLDQEVDLYITKISAV